MSNSKPRPGRLAAIFRRARGKRTLRAVGQDTGVNFELWRKVELGMVVQVAPSVLIRALAASRRLSYGQLVRALVHDSASELARRYMRRGNLSRADRAIAARDG